MKIAIVTDAWFPQVNGVVRTLSSISQQLTHYGHNVNVISPALGPTIACPTYGEIRLSLAPKKIVTKELQSFQPDSIHIATEGPLGWAARAYCLKYNLKFTTSFHTRFPEYVRARSGLPLSWTYKFLKKFHAPSSAILAPTPTICEVLEANGFKNVKHWTRGVDLKTFRPVPAKLKSEVKPILLYVGRVAVEKNIEAFLKLDMRGQKVVVGDGPQRQELEEKYKDVQFVGMKESHELPAYYSSADVFVFPSLTDTFGLVMIEALACGTPVAAFNGTCAQDIIYPEVGALHANLEIAIKEALNCSRLNCEKYAQNFTWENCAHIFLDELVTTTSSTANAPHGSTWWESPRSL
jgi:glycosyltransferase involved in cell wall biosynthesis